MRALVIGEKRQALEVQIIFADALVGFARSPRAKNDVTPQMRCVIQAHRKAAFNGNQIDDVHHDVDLRQALASNRPAQERLGRATITRGIFPERLVGPARHLDLWRFQYAARERQALDFERSRFHLGEELLRRRARFHARCQAAQSGARAFFL